MTHFVTLVQRVGTFANRPTQNAQPERLHTGPNPAAQLGGGGRKVTQLEIALAERDAGIRQSADHAEAVESGWGESCYRILCDFIRETREFNSYEFRQFLRRIGFPVEVPKALGAVLLRAARAGLIRKIGYDQHPERHASPTPRWGRA